MTIYALSSGPGISGVAIIRVSGLKTAKVIKSLTGSELPTPRVATLRNINKINTSNFIMSYSYGRALQQSALKFWSKNIKDIQGTQEVFNHRAKMNSLAAQGKWSKEIEN